MSTPANDLDLARRLALQRLAVSRAHLRHDMVRSSRPAGAAGGGMLGLPRRVRVLWRALRRGVRGSPLSGAIDLASAALQGWWHSHPWRSSTELVARELRGAAAPVVRQHPVVAMAAAAAIGVLLIGGRAWVWPMVAQQLRPVPRQMGRWLIAQLTQAPGQALLSSLLVLMARRQAGPAPSAGGATAQATTPVPPSH